MLRAVHAQLASAQRRVQQRGREREYVVALNNSESAETAAIPT